MSGSTQYSIIVCIQFVVMKEARVDDKEGQVYSVPLSTIRDRMDQEHTEDSSISSTINNTDTAIVHADLPALSPAEEAAKHVDSIDDKNDGLKQEEHGVSQSAMHEQSDSPLSPVETTEPASTQEQSYLGQFRTA